MTANGSFHPNWASSPGDTILDVLEERGLTPTELALRLEEKLENVHALLQGRAPITIALAKRLQAALGASAEFWMARDYLYREDAARRDSAAQTWLSELPVADLIRFGWINPAPTPEREVEACLKFFAVPDITTWRHSYSRIYSNVVFRTSKTLDSKPGAVAAWLRRGEIEATGQECKPWDRDAFRATLFEVKRLTRVKDPQRFLPQLQALCSSTGVAVVVVPSPSGCRASGATRFLEPKKALLQLSFRYLTDDHFWFTFFHEAGHLVLHGDRELILEGLSSPVTVAEEQANQFATDVLIPQGVKPLLSSVRPSTREVLRLARLAGVSPGIIVGQLQFLNRLKPNHLNGLKRRFAWVKTAPTIREKL